MNALAELSAAEVRDLVESHDERDYVLIDVREHEEYLAGHIPGALHIPLMTLLENPGQVVAAPYTIFYCRSGRRSLHAAMVVGRLQQLDTVYNMQGGILDWHGQQLLELPNIRVFEAEAGLRDLLRQAMNLEKGAHRLYLSFAAAVDTDPRVGVFARLIEDEAEHAHHLYTMVSRLDGPPLPPFEQLFDELDGNLLESAESYSEVAAMAKTARGEAGNIGLLEVALDMELKAFELYRIVAHRADDQTIRDAFVELAEMEKRHAMALLRTLAAYA
jgi:rubrerythrin